MHHCLLLAGTGVGELEALFDDSAEVLLSDAYSDVQVTLQSRYPCRAAPLRRDVAAVLAGSRAEPGPDLGELLGREAGWYALRRRFRDPPLELVRGHAAQVLLEG